ncbi:MAG: pentapeptide repeat-containing protein [Pseudomonadota bacterium]
MCPEKNGLGKFFFKGEPHTGSLNIYLQGTNLKGANLTMAILEGAIFNETTEVIYEQLLEVKSLFEARGLSVDLVHRLRKSKPELFEKPEFKLDDNDSGA